jgi:hypothetical protein
MILCGEDRTDGEIRRSVELDSMVEVEFDTGSEDNSRLRRPA